MKKPLKWLQDTYSFDDRWNSSISATKPSPKQTPFKYWSRASWVAFRLQRLKVSSDTVGNDGSKSKGFNLLKWMQWNTGNEESSSSLQQFSRNPKNSTVSLTSKESAKSIKDFTMIVLVLASVDDKELFHFKLLNHRFNKCKASYESSYAELVVRAGISDTWNLCIVSHEVSDTFSSNRKPSPNKPHA